MAESKVEELEKIPTTEAATVSSLPAATDVERDLAARALHNFEQRQFDVSLSLLAQLMNSRGHDPKVMHNKAVVEYYKEDMAMTDEFKKAIQEIAYRDKGRLNLDNVANLDDVDHCILYYNHAVILYHLRQYSKALIILDKLFQLIEPMEENLSRKVAFLLIELHLCTHQPEKAMGIIGVVDKMLFGNGKISHQTDKEGLPAVKEGTGEPNPANEIYRSKVNMYKVRCYMMMRCMKSCKRELKGLLNMSNTNIPVTFLKAHYEYFRDNLRKAIKVLNSIPASSHTSTESGKSVPMMYYNNMGIIHCHMKKHHLGAFYLRKAIHENGLAVKEYNTVDPTKTLSGRPVHTIAISRHYELLYNVGIILLHCGRPDAAFDSLIQTVQLYQINPRLWLRLAECCIMAYRDSNMEDRKLSNRLQVVTGSEGAGVHHKLILGQGLQDRTMGSSESSVIPGLTLEFASLCLRNALMLLPEDPVLRKSPGRNVDSDHGDAKQAVDNTVVPAPPGNPMRGTEISNLRCSILTSSAYVSLCLNDYLVALQSAEQLLKQPRLSGAHSYLGHLYQAEALVALDRIADAVGHLDPELVTDVSVTFPENKADLEKEKNGEKDQLEQDEIKGALYTWHPRDIPQAKSIMQYNLATAHAIRGEYEKALDNLSKSTQTIGVPLPAQIYFLKLYLELMEGRRKAALTIVKEHFGHVTPARA